MLFLYQYSRPALAVIILYLAASAGESPPPNLTLSLATAPAIVRRHNPSLAAARWRVGEARGRLRQAGRLANPEIETSFQHDPDWRELRGGIALKQSLPLTSRLRHEKEVLRAELQAAEAEVDDFERRLIGQAQEVIVEVLAFEAQRANQMKQIEAADELIAFIEDRLGKAEGSELDANRAKLERTRLGLEVRRLENEHGQALGRLMPLLGLPPEGVLTVAGDLPPAGARAPAADAEVEARSDYRAAAHLAEAAEREIALEQSNRYDDLSVALFLERGREEDAPHGLENETAVGFRLSIPVPFWNKNEGAIQEKRAKHARRRKELEAVAQQARHETSNARAVMDAQSRLLAEIDAVLLPDATKQKEALEEAYKQGLSDLASVLRARRQGIELGSVRIDALRDYHRAQVQLQTATR